MVETLQEMDLGIQGHEPGCAAHQPTHDLVEDMFRDSGIQCAEGIVQEEHIRVVHSISFNETTKDTKQ